MEIVVLSFQRNYNSLNVTLNLIILYIAIQLKKGHNLYPIMYIDKNTNENLWNVR
jgi:hypothetical protein